MYLAIRIAVIAAIVFAHLLARGHSSFAESFVTYLVAVLVAHATIVVLARIVRSKHPERPNPNVHATLALAGSSIAILAGALVLHLFAGHHEGPIEYRTVDVVMADPDRWVDEELKLHGYVELGSMRVAGQERTFVLQQNKQRVTARVTGPVPETFQDRAEVVATGRLTRAADGYLFVATDIVAKCPSTYQTANGPVPAARFR